jgi:uncharacterized protein
MLFNVSQLLRETTGSTRRYTVDEGVDIPGETVQVIRFSGSVLLLRTPRSILVEAHLSGNGTGTCARCLQPALVPLELTIEEEFFPTIDPVTGVHLAPPEEPDAFRIDEHHHLDITEAVRQAAVLAEPMQVLCRPDCLGLCPQCGADRNLGACRCPAEPIDERWAALRRLEIS